MSRLLAWAFAGIAMLVTAPAAGAQTTCFAAFDTDGDGSPLSVGDYVLAMRALAGDTDAASTILWYQIDLNGDCVVDAADLAIVECYFMHGAICLGEPFPVPTCCEPARAIGACCFGGDSCAILGQSECAASGGDYRGDGTTCLPDSPCDCCTGLRDDPNQDGIPLNIEDVLAAVRFLFIGPATPFCPEEADVDASGAIEITDLTYAVNYLFRDGPAPMPCPGAYPSSWTFEVQWYDLADAAPAGVDTLNLTFYGPPDYLVRGQFDWGYPDSVAGYGTIDRRWFLYNLEPLVDAGFSTSLWRYGDVFAGTWEFQTIAGPRYRIGLMYPLPD